MIDNNIPASVCMYVYVSVIFWFTEEKISSSLQFICWDIQTSSRIKVFSKLQLVDLAIE